MPLDWRWGKDRYKRLECCRRTPSGHVKLKVNILLSINYCMVSMNKSSLRSDWIPKHIVQSIVHLLNGIFDETNSDSSLRMLTIITSLYLNHAWVYFTGG